MAQADVKAQSSRRRGDDQFLSDDKELLPLPEGFFKAGLA
jgi:hypothetical protein